MNGWYWHAVAAFVGALIYYAYVRFSPNASVQTPNPLSRRAYLVKDWKPLVWGLTGTAVAYIAWVLLHQWGVAVTLPADWRFVGGKTVAVPAMNWLVAAFLGYAGRTICKIGPVVKEAIGARLRKIAGILPPAPPVKPTGEA